MLSSSRIADLWGRAVLFAVCALIVLPEHGTAVGSLPIITAQPTNQTVSVQGSATFSVAVYSQTTISYQWLKNGASIGGATSSSCTLNNVQTGDAGTYSVKVSNGAGTITSSSAILTVDNPPTIQQQPASQTVTQGTSATFSVSASGTAPLTYQWAFDGASLKGATSASLTLNNVQASEAGTFTVVVTDPVGSITSQSAILTVDTPPTITTQPVSQSVLFPQSATFSVVASGTSPLIYQWYLNGAAIDEGTTSTLTITNTTTNNAGSYDVVVQNNWGSITSSVVTLTVDVAPSITIQPQSQTVTSGSDATFSVTASGTATLSYKWYINGNGVNGSHGRNSTYTVSSAGTSDDGTYTVVVENDYGSVTSAVAILTVDSAPAVTTQPKSQAVLLGQNVSLSVTASGTATLGYQWNFNGSPLAGDTNSSFTITNLQAAQGGSYTVIVTNAVGSVTSTVATLTVDLPPTITTQPQSQTVSLAQSATFSVVAAGTAPFSYQWYLNGSPILLANGSSYSILLALTSGGYSVVVKNNYGSVTSSVVALTIGTPIITLTLPILGTLTVGGFAVKGSVPAGTTYVIQASTDLRAWIPISTNTTATGAINFTDAAAANYSGRFYRVVPQ